MAEATDASEQAVDAVNEGVIFVNKKTIAEAASFAMGQIFNDAAASARRMNGLFDMAAGDLAKRIAGTDPTEAVSEQKVLTGNDLGQALASLGAAISSLQQFVKGAQTTPPVTP